MNLYYPTLVNKIIIHNETFTFITNPIDVNFPIAFVMSNNPTLKKIDYNSYLFERLTKKIHTLSFDFFNEMYNISREIFKNDPL